MGYEMHIEVNLFATFKALANKDKLILEFKPGQTIQEVFFIVLNTLPALKAHWVDQNGQPQTYVHIYLNNNDITTLSQGIHTPLKDGDVLDFIPPVAGG
jgi:molybdopterin synthase sulfur carrier subunit